LIHDLARVAHPDACCVGDHVRRRQHRAPRYQAARPAPIPGSTTLTPVSDHLDHPRGKREPRQSYPGITSDAEATFTGRPARSTGPPNTTVTVCPDLRSRAPPAPS